MIEVNHDSGDDMLPALGDRIADTRRRLESSTPDPTEERIPGVRPWRLASLVCLALAMVVFVLNAVEEWNIPWLPWVLMLLGSVLLAVPIRRFEKRRGSKL